MTKKKQPQDATMRNVRAANTKAANLTHALRHALNRCDGLEARVESLNHLVGVLVDQRHAIERRLFALELTRDIAKRKE